jgi:hypothetical protein
MWIGNLDGSRLGLVIALSKKRAQEIAGCGRKAFDDYWNEQPVDPHFQAGILYTRPMDIVRGVGERSTWKHGRCELKGSNAS